MMLRLISFVALLVRAENSGSAFMNSSAWVFDGRVFTLFKFRSMRADAELVGRPQWLGPE
jgi:lipopolysaccharide/colanic/teichoic acid biosynthesis glycosyltransferase